MAMSSLTVNDVRESHGKIIQLATYNTNLQGKKGVPQDLVDWLAPSLHVSNFLSRSPRAPDIVAVGFQELLPLHLGLAGLSKAVLDNRASHILSQIEANAPNKERFSLLAQVANAGTAILVYARDDDGLARNVVDVQTSRTSCGPCFLGNKGAAGVRFRVKEGDAGEVYTFVCAHLTPHEPKLAERVKDCHRIVSTLLFPSYEDPNVPCTLYTTSHLFFMGDLNFRMALPKEHSFREDLDQANVLEDATNREALKEYDQLLIERRKGNVFVGLHEGEFWQFKCSYKYQIGAVDTYDPKRVPAWTDRILYATHTDAPDAPKSNIENMLYTSVPSYTTSDHKPIVSMLLLPPPSTTATPILQLPKDYHPIPDPHARIKLIGGRVLDKIVGIVWCFFSVIGAGSAALGIFNFVLGLGAWEMWKRSE